MFKYFENKGRGFNKIWSRQLVREVWMYEQVNLWGSGGMLHQKILNYGSSVCNAISSILGTKLSAKDKFKEDFLSAATFFLYLQH